MSDRALPGTEPLPGIFDRIEDGLAYARDGLGLTWEIPARVICGVSEGHVFAMDLESKLNELSALLRLRAADALVWVVLAGASSVTEISLQLEGHYA